MIWGTGTPKREFMYSEDMADACVHLINLDDIQYKPLLGANRNDGVAPVVNIGVGEDLTIKELAEIIKDTIGFRGEIEFDSSKPDGTMRKVLDVNVLKKTMWNSKTSLIHGIKNIYKTT
jgi:GDP-L-fucose synthase